MRLQEREKDLRANDILEIFIREFYNMLNFKNSILDPVITCMDYNRPNRVFRVRGHNNYEATLDKLQGKWPDIKDHQILPIHMMFELHTFMKTHVSSYEVGDAFPKMIIRYDQDDFYFAYDYANKTVRFDLKAQLYKQKFEKYKQGLKNFDDIETFYVLVENTLFKGDIPNTTLIHEMSHMFDDLMEFDLSVVGTPQDIDSVDPNLEPEEAEREKKRRMKVYLNDTREVEAWIRQTVFPYYKENIGLFQYVAERLIAGQDVNFLIGDIIKDMIQEFKEMETSHGTSVWDEYTEKTKTKVSKRMFQAINSLLSREVDKLANY